MLNYDVGNLRSEFAGVFWRAHKKSTANGGDGEMNYQFIPNGIFYMKLLFRIILCTKCWLCSEHFITCTRKWGFDKSKKIRFKRRLFTWRQQVGYMSYLPLKHSFSSEFLFFPPLDIVTDANEAFWTEWKIPFRFDWSRTLLWGFNLAKNIHNIARRVMEFFVLFLMWQRSIEAAFNFQMEWMTSYLRIPFLGFEKTVFVTASFRMDLMKKYYYTLLLSAQNKKKLMYFCAHFTNDRATGNDVKCQFC